MDKGKKTSCCTKHLRDDKTPVLYSCTIFLWSYSEFGRIQNYRGVPERIVKEEYNLVMEGKTRCEIELR